MAKRIRKYLLLASVSILLSSCTPIRNGMYNNTLEYVNNIGLAVSFPESDILLEEETFKALIANVDTGAILYEHLMKPVPRELSDALFLGWYKDVWERDFKPNINDAFPYDSTFRVFEYYLDDRKSQETFYYIGKVFLSENFDSFLVATKESDEKLQKLEDAKREIPELAEWPNSIYNRIYIVNVKDSLMVSMTMLWWAWDYEFDPGFTYTIAQDKEFRQRECNILSENYNGFQLFNPETWFMRDPTKGVKFRFDKNGNVVLE